MSESRTAAFARRVRTRLALAWEESRVAAPPLHDDARRADSGETLFVPATIAARLGGFPATKAIPTIAVLERRLGVPATRIRLAVGAWTPCDEQSLPEALAHAADLAHSASHGERIYWVQPLSNNFVLSTDEVEQIAGLAGGVEFVEETRTVDGTIACIIAAATVRRCDCGVAIVWSPALLADEHARSAALRRLSQMPAPVRSGTHLIEVPAHAPAGPAGLRELLSALSEADNAVFGVRVRDNQDGVAALLAAAADVPSVHRRLLVQWVDRPDGFGALQALAPFIQLDCSLAADAADDVAPYVTSGPYRPLAFDARVPAAGNEAAALVELPRVPGLAVRRDVPAWLRTTVSPERRAEADFQRFLETPIEQTLRRLRSVLDLPRRREYLKRLEAERSLVSAWPEFHVYNWPPPPRDILRLVTYDATDLNDPGSALCDLTEARRVPMLPGAELVRRAFAIAAERAGAPARIRAKQIAAHGYLADGGRQTLTADSETLIDALPASLGATLEIGFGYALTARRVRSRATRYIGIELMPEQARALDEAGGAGLVADLLALPFSGNAFDTIIADNVLEHAASPVAALSEVRRVLRNRGRLYALIPLDAATSEFQIRTHLWKADEHSIRRAAALADLHVVELRVLSYAALGVYGAFPASRGRTCLAVFEPTATAQRIAV